MKNVISFAKINETKLIMNLSSIDVYGNIKKSNLKEDYLPLKPGVYGKMKYLSEKMLFEEKINFINLRLPGVLCKKSKDFEKPWLNKIIYQIKKNKVIYAYDLKKKFNNIINSDEIARLFKFIIKKNIIIRDTFNFASTKPINLYEILSYIKKKISSDSKIFELRDTGHNSFHISVKKLEKTLNFKTISTKKLLNNFL